jgi:uncharacterized protein YbjT (DUF2867 family)
MILVTGGTGFVGRALVRQLVSTGYSVRTLIRPSPRTPNLPRGVPVEVAVVGLSDERGLRAALRGVDIVYHLASAEQQRGRSSLLDVDIRGTDNLVRAAADARVKRLFYVSHLGADRASAFPVQKAKGIAEESVRRSGLDYTILRSSILYGPEDHFTTAIARLSQLSPVFFVPNKGEVMLQPLWVEDLVTCLLWSLDNSETLNQTYEVGGNEYFSFRQVVDMVFAVLRTHRIIASASSPLMRAITVLLEDNFPNFPSSVFWLDYLAVNRTCPVDSIPRVFGFLPARFTYRLEHLKSVNWFRLMFQSLVKHRYA